MLFLVKLRIDLLYMLSLSETYTELLYVQQTNTLIRVRVATMFSIKSLLMHIFQIQCQKARNKGQLLHRHWISSSNIELMYGIDILRHFPSGAVVMNLPANTADAGQISIRVTINSNKNTTDLRENQVEGEYTGFLLLLLNIQLDTMCSSVLYMQNYNSLAISISTMKTLSKIE